MSSASTAINFDDFNGWWSNLASCIFNESNIVAIKNQLHAVITTLFIDTKLPFNIPVDSFIEGPALNLANMLSDTDCKKSRENLIILKELARLIVLLKKYGISTRTFDAYLSFMTPTNKIFITDNLTGKSFGKWDFGFSLVGEDESALWQLVNDVTPIVSLLSIRSLNTLLCAFDYISLDHKIGDPKVPVELITPIINEIFRRIEDKTSDYYRTSSATIFRMALQILKRIFNSYGSEYRKPYLHLLRNTAVSCIDSVSFESNKLGLIILTFLFKNNYTYDFFNVDSIIMQLLNKDLNNAVIEEIPALFKSLAKINYLNFDHLNQVWEKCQSAHTTQKDAYLMIICKSLSQLDNCHGFGFVEAIIDNSPDDPSAYKILLYLLQTKEFIQLRSNIVEKIINANLSGKSPALPIIKELGDYMDKDISKIALAQSIDKFRENPTSYITMIIWMAVQNANPTDIVNGIKLKDITHALKTHSYPSGIAQLLLAAFLRKTRQFKLKQKDIVKILTFPNKHIFKLFNDLITEDSDLYFTDDGISELYSYLVGHPVSDENYMVLLVKVAQLYWQQTGHIVTKVTPNEVTYEVKSRDENFESTLKYLIFSLEPPNEYISNEAMLCLISIWDGLEKNEYRQFVLNLFDDIYTSMENRSENIKLLKAMLDKRCLNKTFESLGYIRHKDNVIVSPRVVFVQIKSQEIPIIVHRDDKVSSLITKIGVMYRQYVKINLDHGGKILDRTKTLKELKLFNKRIGVIAEQTRNPEVIPIETPALILSNAGEHGRILDLIEGGLISDEDQVALSKLLNVMPDDPDVVESMNSMEDYVETLKNVSLHRLQYMLECFLARSHNKKDINDFVNSDGISVLTSSYATVDNPLQLRVILNILKNCQNCEYYKSFQDSIIPFIVSKMVINGCMQPIVDMLIPFGEDALNYVESNTFELKEIIEHLKLKSMNNFMKIFTRFCPSIFQLCKDYISHPNFALLFVDHCTKDANNELANAQFCFDSMVIYPAVSNILSHALDPLFQKIPPKETVTIVEGLLLLAKQPLYADARSAIYKAMINARNYSNSKLISNYIQSLVSDVRVDSYHYNPALMKRNENGVGLKNLGATCYINSVLQMLRSLKPFMNRLMEADVENESMKNFKLLMANLQLGQQKFVNPDPFVSSFRMFGDLPINVREQQDAIEFYASLMDQLPQSVQDLFNGDTQTVIRGLDDEFENQRTETSLCLDLEISRCTKISDSFMMMLEHERFEGENGYKIDEYGTKVDYERFSQITKTPEVLCLHLKRFGYDNDLGTRIKINSKFDFPLGEFSISKYVQKGTANTHYQFHGAIIHRGDAMRGHYFTIVKKDTDEYIKYDDSDVSIISEEEFIKFASGGNGTPISESAYILFYIRNDVINEQGNFSDFCPKEIKDVITKEDEEFDKHRNLFDPQLCTLAIKHCSPKAYLDYVFRIFVHSTLKSEVANIEFGMTNRIRGESNAIKSIQYFVENLALVLETIMRCPEQEFVSFVTNHICKLSKTAKTEQVVEICEKTAQAIRENYKNIFNVSTLSVFLKNMIEENKFVYQIKDNTIVDKLCEAIQLMFNAEASMIYLQSIDATCIFDLLKNFAANNFFDSMSCLEDIEEYAKYSNKHVSSFMSMKREVIQSKTRSMMAAATDNTKSNVEISQFVQRLDDNLIGPLLVRLNKKLQKEENSVYQVLIENSTTLLINPLKTKECINALHLVTTALPSSAILRDSPMDRNIYENELVNALSKGFADILADPPKDNLPKKPEFFMVLKALILDFSEITIQYIPLSMILKLISMYGKLNENRKITDTLMECLYPYKEYIQVEDVLNAIDIIQSSLMPIRHYAMILFISATSDVKRRVIHLDKFKGYIKNHLRVINAILEGSEKFVDILIKLWDKGEADAGECLFFFLDHQYTNYVNVNNVYKGLIRALPMYPELTKHYTHIFQRILLRKEDAPVQFLVNHAFENDGLVPSLHESLVPLMVGDKWEDGTVSLLKKFLLREMQKSSQIKSRVFKETEKNHRFASLAPMYYVLRDKQEKFMEYAEKFINEDDLYISLLDSSLPRPKDAWLKSMVTNLMCQVKLISEYSTRFYIGVLNTFGPKNKKDVLKKVAQSTMNRIPGRVPKANRRFIKALGILTERDIQNVEKGVTIVLSTSSSESDADVDYDVIMVE